MRRLFALTGLLAALWVAPPAHAVPAEGLAWTWDPGTSRTWFVEVEIVLPDRYLLVVERSREARMVAFQTEAVFTCSPVAALSKRQVELACKIDDFSIRGAPMPGDSIESMATVLTGIDETLTGATLQVHMRDDGRIMDVDLEGASKRDARRASMHENLRVILLRSLAGFDLQLPRKGVSAEGVWPQYQSMLMQAPSSTGTTGSGEIAHLVRSLSGDYVILESAGRGTVVPDAGRNLFESELTSVAVFDVAEHMLRERVWSFRGEPTAGSATAEAGTGVPYIQNGRILYLPEGADAPAMQESAPVEPPGMSKDSAIMDWIQIGSRG